MARLRAVRLEACTGAIGAFTFIEVMVVVAVVLLLAGLLMPMVGLARRASERSRTLAVLHKVDAALHAFKAEFGVFPYQSAYPNLANGETFAQHPNSLAYSIATNISSAASSAVLGDMAAAASALDESTGSGLCYSAATAAMSANDAQSAARSTLLNRMARERARLAVLAGDVGLRGPCFNAGMGLVDLSGSAVLTAPLSVQQPGWAEDYLQGELDAHCINPATQSILDDYGHPLIYICQLLPGEMGSVDCSNGNLVSSFDARAFGLGPQAFPGATGPAASLEAAGRWLLLDAGRIRLSANDAGDGQPTPADPVFFPNPGLLMHSDVRYYAAPGYENGCELWSAGPDGQFTWMRDDPANADNIAADEYNRGLQ